MKALLVAVVAAAALSGCGVVTKKTPSGEVPVGIVVPKLFQVEGGVSLPRYTPGQNRTVIQHSFPGYGFGGGGWSVSTGGVQPTGRDGYHWVPRNDGRGYKVAPVPSSRSIFDKGGKRK